MKKCLFLAGILLISSLCISEPAHAADYETRLVSTFETAPNETTPYGNWTARTLAINLGASFLYSTIESTTYRHYHLNHSVALEYAIVGPGAVYANFTFDSNTTLGTFLFNDLVIMYQLSGNNHYSWAYYDVNQYGNGTVLSSLRHDLAPATTWQAILVPGDWFATTTNFSLSFHLANENLGGSDDGAWGLYLDYFCVLSDQVDVRIRYWNLYTGLGYYAEKLLARYYTLSGWVDVWQNEFQSFRGNEELLQVTDVFGRNVWTGIISIDSDPVYVDILVPIVTVYIPKPDWYNDSVPMEWRITCLPWGPDGAAGMDLPATGFEFEVLAGWYSISWVENHYVQAGNQTIYIDGNISERRSFMLSNLSIPINPEYAIEVGGGKVLNLGNPWDWLKIIAALYDDWRVKAISFGMLFVAIAVYVRETKKHAERRLRGGTK